MPMEASKSAKAFSRYGPWGSHVVSVHIATLGDTATHSHTATLTGTHRHRHTQPHTHTHTHTHTATHTHRP